MGVVDRLLARIGRVLHPLFNPHEAWLRDRLETILGEQRRDVGTALKALERQQKQIDSLDDQVERLRDSSNAELTAVRRAVKAQHMRLRRQLGFSERVLRRATDHTPAYREERALDRLEKIARSTRPVFVGPWTGEVGFELVYWIPFVRWVVAHYGIDPERLVVCSRGGPRSWYQGLGGRYVDVFAVATPEEFRRHTIEKPKQRTVRQFDREVMRRAVASGIGPVAVLHPALMYHLFMPFWKEQAPAAQVLQYSQFRRLRPFALPGVTDRLPRQYVAVRFYFSNCFPDTPDNRAFASRVIAQLAEETDVVVLDPGLRVDDHADATVAESPRIHRLDMSAAPEHNLEVQSAVLAGASGFVGTYGGYSYLAPLFGVPALAIFSERNFYLHHLHVAQRAIEEVNGGTLTVMHTRDAGLLRAAVGAADSAGLVPPER